MQEVNISSSSYFRSLTGVRAIAAYLVFFHHFNYFDKDSYVYGIFKEFYIGVTIFFVLSGFLISNRYLNSNKFFISEYFANRFARIYPVYFILTIITFYFHDFYQGSFFYTRLILNLTMLRGFFEYYKFTGVEQGWSLTVEETFYILAPTILFLISRRKIFLIILPIIFLLFGVLMVQIFSKYSLSGFFYSNEFMFNYTFFGRCIEFFVGIFLTILLRNNFRISFSYFTHLGILFIIISIILLLWFKGNNNYGIQNDYGKIINTFFLPLFGIMPFFYGLIREKTLLSKALSSNIFQLLGKSSYAFYLIHVGIFEDTLSNILPEDGLSKIFISFIILNILAIIIYKYIENPINNLIRSIFSRHIE